MIAVESRFEAIFSGKASTGNSAVNAIGVPAALSTMPASSGQNGVVSCGSAARCAVLEMIAVSSSIQWPRCEGNAIGMRDEATMHRIVEV